MLHSIQGEVSAPFWRVAQALEKQVRRSGGGAAVAVYHRGRKVVDIWGGTRDEGGNPWREDTMAMSFSTSKGVVSTLAHIFADRGALDYERPVARYWPEFGRNGKQDITVRQALTHRAGLAPLRPLIDAGDRILDWDYMVRALEDAEARPGRRSAYHALTYGWLLGELIQRVAGKPLPEVIEQELAGPLGLDGCYIGAPPDAIARAASLGGGPSSAMPRLTRSALSDPIMRVLSNYTRLWRLPINPKLMFEALVPPGDAGVMWERRILEVPVPAANGLFTARSLARIYAAIAGGGSLDGVRLFSRRTAARIAEVNVHSRDKVIPIRMNWRLGYHGAFTSRGMLDSAFGHFGFGGSGAWADPERSLAVAMVNNALGGGPFGDGRIAYIGTAAVRAVDGIEGRGLERVPEPVSLEALAAD